LHFPHPKVKNVKKVHRLVVLPDYQGIGIGNRLLEVIGHHYKSRNFRFTIVTASPALIHYFAKSGKWKLKHQGRMTGGTAKANQAIQKTVSTNRLTTSWELR